MKLLYILPLLVLTNSFTIMAQTSSNWQGTYHGTIENTPVTMTLKVQGHTVTGQVNAEGYLYNLSCTAEGKQCTGIFSDPQTQGSLPMKMDLDGNTINLVLTNTDPYTGMENAVAFTFNRGKAPEPNSGTSPAKGTGTEAPAGTLDMRLVGEWLYMDTYFSGDFNMTTQLRLIMKADGTFLHGDAKLAGGGAYGSVQSGGGNYNTGRWKTENSIIYVDEGQGWQPYCKYYVEGNSFMMTFDNGKRQLWNRN